MKNEIYMAEWKHSRWLVLSSGFFVIPSIYSYYIKFYGFSILLLLTSLISANYWRKQLIHGEEPQIWFLRKSHS